MIDPTLEKLLKKKIKRRLWYEVTLWHKNSAQRRIFNSAKRMRRYVNILHKENKSDYPIDIQKWWCYRNHQPRHMWYYVSSKTDEFVCVEHY